MLFFVLFCFGRICLCRKAAIALSRKASYRRPSAGSCTSKQILRMNRTAPAPAEWVRRRQRRTINTCATPAVKGSSAWPCLPPPPSPKDPVPGALLAPISSREPTCAQPRSLSQRLRRRLASSWTWESLENHSLARIRSVRFRNLSLSLCVCKRERRGGGERAFLPAPTWKGKGALLSSRPRRRPVFHLPPSLPTSSLPSGLARLPCPALPLPPSDWPGPPGRFDVDK